MRKICLVLLSCSVICLAAYRWGDIKWESAKQKGMEYLYTEISNIITPYMRTYEMKTNALVYADIEGFLIPLLSEFRTTKYEVTVKEENINSEIEIETENKEQISTETEETIQSEVELPEVSVDEETSTIVSGVPSATDKKVTINRTKLQEFDYLRQNFYQVDNTTTVGSELLDVNMLLGKDMTLKENVSGPQILIYHTHSQEGYKDTVPGDPSTTIVGVGDYLEKLLEEKYGINVLHHKGVYDLPSRDNAYSAALPNIEKLLQEFFQIIPHSHNSRTWIPWHRILISFLGMCMID